MSDIVERVAEALWDSDGESSISWDQAVEHASRRSAHGHLDAYWISQVALYRAGARAALAALREPDEAMLDAGAIVHRDGAAACWRAMVDVAHDAPPAGKEVGYSAVGPEKPPG